MKVSGYCVLRLGRAKQNYSIKCAFFKNFFCFGITFSEAYKCIGVLRAPWGGYTKQFH